MPDSLTIYSKNTGWIIEYKKKPLITEWVVFCILMVSFSVYYLGVYMFLGLMNLFIFSEDFKCQLNNVMNLSTNPKIQI